MARVAPHRGSRPRTWAKRTLAFLTPRGWRHLLLQILLLWGFEVIYALSGLYARRQLDTALDNAAAVLELEGALGIAIEHGVQNWALAGPDVLIEMANRTYFACQFGVTAVFVLWVYTCRQQHFWRVRNALLTANFVSLPIMLAFPTAPPRLLPDAGFADTLNANEVNLNSGLIDALNNPYSAMPSLHASYALVIGAAGTMLTRAWWARLAWACYPGLVVYSIVATGNHFLLDAAIGGVALLAVPVGNRLAYRLAGAAPPPRPSRRLSPAPSPTRPGP